MGDAVTVHTFVEEFCAKCHRVVIELGGDGEAYSNGCTCEREETVWRDGFRRALEAAATQADEAGTDAEERAARWERNGSERMAAIKEHEARAARELAKAIRALDVEALVGP